MDEQELIDKTDKIVEELEGGWEEGSQDHQAARLCVMLYLCTFDSWDALQIQCPKLLESDPETIGQLVVNLRMGGALLEDGYHVMLRKQIEDEFGSTTMMLLVNIACGRMRYLTEQDSFQLTDVGKRYVEAMIA